MSFMNSLLIDALIPEILQSLEKNTSAVMVAEPGAGKTTRVPPALLSSPFTQGKEIWVLQPRRLAAKLAALRVAEEINEEPGKRVGYQFRFEKKAGPETRLRFMTDGMLFPLSQSDPSLSKVAAVILDEFHERSLALELGLACLRRLQMGTRPDLRLLVMSATLDSDALSNYLGGCPVMKSKGRVFPVTVDYLPQPEQRDLELKVKTAVKNLAAKGPGTTLVFLPGLYEIKRCQEVLKSEPLEVHALYGDLSVEEQQSVLRPTEGRRVILSTNVAETSLTVPGVTAVVDSGLTRQARVSAWSGLSSLVTVPASQASASQRTGRAGRLQEGACLRLYTKFDFEHRAAFDVPEILRTDLSKSLLDLMALGINDLEKFPWFLPPPPAALESAHKLLIRLGAQILPGQITETGRRMARFPLPPRLAKFLLEVEKLAQGNPATLRDACRLAVLISEEDADTEDLLEELRRFKPAFESRRLEDQLAGMFNSKSPSPSRGEGRGEGEDEPPSNQGTPHPGSARPLPQGARGKNGESNETILSKALLTAFPDRVARVRSEDFSQTRNRSGKIRELLLSTGGTAIAQDNPLTRGHEYFVVVEAQETQQGPHPKVRSLCPIEEDWLLDLFPDGLKEEQTCEWNDKAKKVEGFKRLKYGQLVLDEKPMTAADFGPEARAILLKQALSAGPQSFCDPVELDAFLNRVKFVAGRTRDLMEISPEKIRETLTELAGGCKSLEDLREAGLVTALRAGLSPKEQGLLEKWAPNFATLPTGRRLDIHYEADKGPWAQSRLQDFLGMTKGPAVAGGEVPVVLHLLSPGKKPVQITSDLAGFWRNHYPQIRKELMRRYPRHQWPENPLAKT